MKRLILLFLLLSLPLSALASVNVLSGNLSHRQNLFTTQGGSMPLQMTLQYNGLDKISGQIGVGWSHSFEIYLHENSDGTLVMTGGVAKRFYFPDGNGGYVSRTGDYSTLIANGDSTYTINFPSGSIYQFDSNKKLSSLTDRHGNSLNLDYSVADQLTVADPTGRRAVIHYDANSRVDWLKDPAGAQFDLTYNVNGQMETIIYPEPQPGVGRPLYTFNYTADGLLEYSTDPNLQISKYIYHQGRVVRTVAPEGVLDTNGNETADSTQYSKTYTYGTSIAPARTSANITSTTAQTRVTKEDGSQWLYFYDVDEGILLGKQDPLGNLSEYVWYNSASSYYGQRQYSQIPFEDNGTKVSYRMTSYNSYDAYGNPLDITTRIRTISYDTSGNQTNTVDDPVHHHLTYAYGTYNRPTSITNVIAGTTTTINYNEPGDGTEIVTLTAPKINAADSTGPQTIMIYRSDGQLNSITDPLGRIIDYNYDAIGTLTSVTDSHNIVSNFGDFDALGLAQTVILIGSDGTSTRTTSLQYDALAQLIKITRGNTTPLITEFDYDGVGNRNSVLDAEQNETSLEHDSRGQIIKITSLLHPGTAEEQQLDTQLNYQNSSCPGCSGGLDKLSALTDAKNQTTQFNYDTLGRMIKETDAENNSLGYTYYTDGRPRQKFEGEPESGTLLLTYEYTADGKLQIKKDAANNILASYSYDSNNRLQSATTPQSSSIFSYYDNGWLKTVDNGTYLIEYQYDQLGRRELVNIKQGATILHSIDYVYDPTTKELESIVSDQAGTFSFDYDAFQRRATLNYPNGIVGTYSYDDANQTNWLKEIKYTDAGTDLLTIGYPQHDKVGNRKQRTEDGTITDYTYDDLYRITQAKTGPREESFTYDQVGNRESGPTVKDTADKAYDHNAANQMGKGRKFTYDYDSSGNQTHRYLNAAQTKYWQYSWTPENQLQQAKFINNGTTIRTINYQYDAFGRRTKKTVIQGSTTTTTYIYDGEDIVLQIDNDGVSTIITYYTHGPGIDEPLAQTQNSQTTYYHADGLGSIVAITDASGNIVQRYSYEAFGQLTASDPTFDNFYTYTGREYDKETGLYYDRARYCDAMEGRFLSKDPISFAGGDVNLYNYVGGNPINYVDPSGLFRFGIRDLKSTPYGSRHYQRISPILHYVMTCNNLDFKHVQGFFEDGSGDNIGFFAKNGAIPAGIHRDDNFADYDMSPYQYDDDLMRKSLANVTGTGNFGSDDYELTSNNCQDFTDSLRDEYRRLGGIVIFSPRSIRDILFY